MVRTSWSTACHTKNYSSKDKIWPRCRFLITRVCSRNSWFALTPPTKNPYTALKEQLIKRTAASEQQRLQQLLSTKQLGDRKPTQFLYQMQQLLGDTPTDGSLIRELFHQRLPTNVRMVLASARRDASLEELTYMADKIMEVASPSIATVQVPPTVTTEIEELHSKVASLTTLVKSFTHHRSPSPTHRHSPAESSHLCWYQQHYGELARKCKEPCLKSGNSSASH